MTSKQLSYYRKINNGFGSMSNKESQIYEIQRHTNRYFKDTIGYNSATVNGVNRDLIIVHDKNPLVKKIYSRPNEGLSLGDVVCWQNVHWLVNDLDADEQIKTSAKMRQCNLLLRWQNKSGDIIERYCFAEHASKYSNGEIVGSILTTPKLSYLIQIPLDSETALLSRGKRFLIDDERYIDLILLIGGSVGAFKLTQRNIMDYNYGSGGILAIIVTQCEYNNKTDNTELMIADYIEIPDKNNSAGNCIITCKGENCLLIGGTGKEFSVAFYDDSGIEIDAKAIWNLVLMPQDAGKIIIDSHNDRNIVLRALNYYSLMHSKCRLEVRDKENTCNSSVDISFKGVL